jgi:uncharacterized protein
MSHELIQSAVNEDNKEFWEYISKGEFRMQQCSSCSSFRFPCSWICPECGDSSFIWEKISGYGEVYTWSVIHKDYHPAFEKKAPYNVAIVALKEGVHFLSNVEVSIDQMEIGMRVKVEICDCPDGSKVPLFIPVGG